MVVSEGEISAGSEKLNFFVRIKAVDLDSCIEATAASFGEDDVDERRYACGVRCLFADTASEISVEFFEVDLDCKLLRDFDADRYAGVRGADDETCLVDPLVGGDDLLDDPLGALNLLLVACCCFRDDEVERVSIDLLRSFPSNAWSASA